MRFNRMLATLAVLTVSVGVNMQALAKEESRFVSASVAGGAGGGVGIRARKQPGPFTVPKGHIATGFKYHFNDPKTNYTSDRLGPANIYSVTEGRDIREAAGNPGIELPPGKYKFVVGGGPGAQGTLSFKIVPTSVEDTGRNPHGNSRLPRSFDVTFSPRDDIYVSDKGAMKRIRDFEGIDHFNYPDSVVVRFRDGNAEGQWKITMPPDTVVTITLKGRLIGDRFTGTDTCTTTFSLKGDHETLSFRMGTEWSVEGKVEPNGVLILHNSHPKAFGNMPQTVKGSDGRYRLTSKAHELSDGERNLRIETHLQLPVGNAPPTSTTRRRPPRTGGGNSQPIADVPPIPNDPGDTPNPNDIWNTFNEERPWETPFGPKVSNNDNDRLRETGDTIWNTDDDTDLDDLVSAPPKDKHGDSPENDTIADPPDDIPDRDHTPKPGDRLADGKILFKPPWDEGGAYPMDEEEVKEIKKRQSEGFRWDKRHGWVNDERQKEINDIADIQRRSDEKERKRSDDTFRELADSEKRSKELADKEKRQGDEAIAEKVKTQGWNSLTREERERLGKADDDIKDQVRGKPKTIRGYKRGIIDESLSQGTIDNIHKGLDWTKTGIDEGMDFLKTKGGPAGELIGDGYTVGSKVLGKLSEENAKYNAGTSDKADYTKAAIDGGKEAATSIITDRIGGKLTDKVTDKLLDSKVGKKIVDRVGKKKPTLLDDLDDRLSDGAKQNVNYGIGRSAKPGVDATIGQATKNAVDWGTGGDESKPKAEDTSADDQPEED